MTEEEMMRYFEKINEELRYLELDGEILITGGASMCLVYHARGMTKDVDAVYEPKTIINDIVYKIAIIENLASDWLNDGVKGFIEPIMDKDRVLVTRFSNLSIYSVSTEALLAMKLTSGRAGSRDKDDAKYLLNKLGIKTIDQAMMIVEKYTPRRANLRTQLFAETLLAEIAKEDGRRKPPRRER